MPKAQSNQAPKVIFPQCPKIMPGPQKGQPLPKSVYETPIQQSANKVLDKVLSNTKKK